MAGAERRLWYRDSIAAPEPPIRSRDASDEADSPAPAGRARSSYRWAILAAGTGGQATYIAVVSAPAVLAPALRDDLGLTIAQAGVVIAAPWVGPIFTLLPWGLLADRIGERRALAAGLAACSAFVLALVPAGGFAALVVLLALAGAAGASVNSASGRAVMASFDASERGLALGIRQTSSPLGGSIAALALPPVVARAGADGAFLLLGGLVFFAAVVGALVLRDATGRADVAPQPRLLRDVRLWRLAGSGAFYLVAQVAVGSFLVLYLHDERGLSVGAAGAVLAVVQVLAVVLRVALGRWSDVLGDRLGPLRLAGLGSALALAATTALLEAPTAVLVSAFVVAGTLSASWNGLSYTAAAELAGHRRSGAAIGLQQTVLSLTGAVVPVLFAATVAATTWRTAFAAAALGPLAGWAALRPLARVGPPPT